VSPDENGDSQTPAQVRQMLDLANELIDNQPKESMVASFEPVKTMTLDAAKNANVVVVPATPVYEVIKHFPVDIDQSTVKAVDLLEGRLKRLL
jgi:hypothetical protein